MAIPAKASSLFVRTLLAMVEFAATNPRRNGDRVTAVVICGNVKHGVKLNDAEKKILICGEFRCLKCFAELVRNQTMAFGVSKEASDEDIDLLLEPVPRVDIPCTFFPVPNLYRPKKEPRFLCVEAVSPHS